jgi:DNA-binding transcriptional MerR regulator
MELEMRSGMQIGKVAEQTGLSVDAIRFYERSGLLHEPLRTEGGYRLFQESDVQELRFVCRAQELGFSLAEIKELILIRQKHDHACTQVRDLLAAKVASVRAKIAELKTLESELSDSLQVCNRDLRRAKKSSHDECCPVLEKLEREERRRRKRG